MSEKLSRAQFLEQNPNARALAALDQATAAQDAVTPDAISLEKGKFAGKSCIIIGSGVAGLTTAYELLAQQSGAEVKIFEALHRTGGRCLSLRTGDVLTEDQDSKLFGSKPSTPQVVQFAQPADDSQPYLNAGPGRIPSSHKRLLSYLQQFAVDIEVYVMNSESNLVQMKDGPFNSLPVVYRRLDHNVRGWLAHMVHENAETLLQTSAVGISEEDLAVRTKQLKELMVSFGELTAKGEYQVTAGTEGFEDGRSRAGYSELPGVSVGQISEPLSFDSLLESKFWSKTKFYQPRDFLWQPTLFQPVGGMDQVQKAFARHVKMLGGEIFLNSPVTKIDYDFDANQYLVTVKDVKKNTETVHKADYVFSNMAIPFLSKILSDDLQGDGDNGFEPDFKAALNAVYKAQFGADKDEEKDEGYRERFLACTTKVGWQADRSLWQGSTIKADSTTGSYSVPDSEVGVVPIFGGISWTEHDITQIWYPSTAYHDQKGILTGAYNFGQIAYDWGNMSVEQRLNDAREGAKGFGTAFGDGLENGVTIAWQNMPYIKGGWAYWQAVGDSTEAANHFNNLASATGVRSSGCEVTAPNFFIVGDQLSSLPGWQEGAIASALNALKRMSNATIPKLACLPDTRLIVEGI